MKLIAVISIAVLTSLAGLALLGAFSANAEETTLRIYLCRKAVPTGSGVYEDDHCRTLGGTTEYYREAEGITPQTATSKASKEFELEFQAVLIKCTTESSVSTAWNPAKASGEGKTTVTFGGCAVAKSAACLPSKKIVTKELSGKMEANAKLGNGVKFIPVSGTTVAVIQLGEECALGEEVILKGTVFGVAKNEESALEFTNESTGLTVGVNTAKLRGSSIVQGEVAGVKHFDVEAP